MAPTFPDLFFISKKEALKIALISSTIGAIICAIITRLLS